MFLGGGHGMWEEGLGARGKEEVKEGTGGGEGY